MNKKIIILLLSRIIQVIASFALLKMSMVFLSPEEMGRFYLLVTMISFVCFSMLGPIGQFANRFCHEWKNENILWSSVIKINNIFVLISVIFGIFVAVSQNYLDLMESFSTEVLLFCAIGGGIFNSLSTLFPGILNIVGHYLSFAILFALNAIFILVFSYITVNIAEPNAEAWMIAKLCGQALVTHIAMFLFWKMYKSNLKTKFDISKLVSYSYPLGITAILMWTQGEGYRFIIENVYGVEYLGLLAIGFSLATRVTSLIETLCHQVIFPDFYKEVTGADNFSRSQSWNKMFNNVLPIYLGTLFLVFFCAPFILRILGTAEYQKALEFIFYGAFIEFFRVLINIIVQIAHAEEKTKDLLLPYTINVAIFITLIFSSKPIFDGNVPLAITCAGFISVICIAFFMNKLIIIRINMKRIFVYFNSFLPIGFSFYLWSYAQSLLISFLVCCLTGAYFLFVLHYFNRKMVDDK